MVKRLLFAEFFEDIVIVFEHCIVISEYDIIIQKKCKILNVYVFKMNSGNVPGVCKLKFLEKNNGVLRNREKSPCLR